MLTNLLLTLIIAFFQHKQAQCQLTVLTPSVTAMLGSNVTLSARYNNSVVATSLVNWYVNTTALTANGILSASSSKYAVFNNGSLFTLTIFRLSSSDLFYYQCIYANPPVSIEIVNATVSQFNVTIVRQISNCQTTSSITAIFTLVLLGYLLLIVVDALLFVMTRTQRAKVSCGNLFCLLLFLQISVALITCMVIIWLTSYSINQNLSYLIASIFGLASYMSIWFGILYILFMFVKEENIFYVNGFSVLAIALIQVGFLVGINICVTHCGNLTTFGSLAIDYGNLGVIFACIIVTLNIYLMIWSIVFTLNKEVQEFAIKLSKKVVSQEGKALIESNNKALNSGLSAKPKKSSAFDKLYARLPRSMQKFIDSARRCFKKPPKEVSKDVTQEFKNIASPTESSRLDVKLPKGKGGSLLSKVTNRSIVEVAKGGKAIDPKSKTVASNTKPIDKKEISKNAVQPSIGEKTKSFVKDPKTNQLVPKDAKKSTNDGKESKMSKADTTIGKKDSKPKESKKKNDKKSKKKVYSDEESDVEEEEKEEEEEEEREENESNEDGEEDVEEDEEEKGDDGEESNEDDENENEEKKSEDENSDSKDDDDDNDSDESDTKKKKTRGKLPAKKNAKSKAKKK